MIFAGNFLTVLGKVVDIIKLFGGKSRFPQNQEIEKILL